jgi:hypothetical protein
MIIKKYFNLKYNTIYFPFKQSGDEDVTRTFNKSHNFGGEKRVDVGGGYVQDEQLKYGLYCKARSLVGFDTNDIDTSITAKNMVAYIRLYNLAQLPTTYTPSTLTIEVYPLTANWQAGTNTSASAVSGMSNWMYRTTTDLWTASGAMDVDFSMSASVSLDPGNKNLELNVTNQLMRSLTGSVRYYGFLLKLPNSMESSTANSYWRKSFYAGDFTVLANLPRLDIVYDEYIADDRDKMVAGSSGNLYFYNFINGNPTSIGFSAATAQIVNENDVVLTSTSVITQDANYTGYYKATLTVPLSAWGMQRDFRDKWIFDFAGGTRIIKDNYLKVLGPVNENYNQKNVQNMNVLFEKEESYKSILCKVKWNEKKYMFFRRSFTYENAELFIPKVAYYRIYTLTEGLTREKWYQSDWDRMSYDKNGNWFTIDKTNFPIGRFYVEFKLDIFGETVYYVDPKWYFNIAEDWVSNSLYW